MVAFGYRAAMAIEEYPEVWVLNAVVFGVFIVGVIIEIILVFLILENEELNIVFEFNGQGDG